MSEESKMRKVTVTMELDVPDTHKTLNSVEVAIQRVFVPDLGKYYPHEPMVITNIDVSGKGFYHLVPNEPAKE